MAQIVLEQVAVRVVVHQVTVDIRHVTGPEQVAHLPVETGSVAAQRHPAAERQAGVRADRKGGVEAETHGLTIAVVALAVAVIGMIFIAVINKNVGYFHAEQKVQDKYAYWEEQLDAREKELQEWEEELSEQAEKINDAKTQN